MLTMTAISFSEVNFTSQFLNKSTIVNQFTLLNQFKEEKKENSLKYQFFPLLTKAFH